MRARIRADRPRIRSAGEPFLAYAVIESIGVGIEDLEEALVDDPDFDTLRRIHQLKRERIFLRKSVWPLRDAVNQILRDEDLPFHEELRAYLRDLYDHTIHVIETVESYRNLNAGMLRFFRRRGWL